MALVDKQALGKRGLFIALAVLQLIVAVGAIPAALSLIIDPSGHGLTWTVAGLKNSPFANYLIPGIFLLVVHGFGSAIGSILALRRHRFCGLVAMGLGLVLILWIIAQVWWMGWLVFLQPLMIAFGLIEMILGFLIHKRIKQVIGTSQ